MFTFPKSLTRLALVFSLLAGFVLTSQAANLPATLQGNYQLKSTSLVVGGLSIKTQLSKVSLPIGNKGLSVITSAKVKNLIKATGVGSGANVTITKVSTTSASFIASGKLSAGGYTVNLTSGSGTATLNTGGLKVKITFTATLNGLSLTGSETFLLKKV